MCVWNNEIIFLWYFPQRNSGFKVSNEANNQTNFRSMSSKNRRKCSWRKSLWLINRRGKSSRGQTNYSKRSTNSCLICQKSSKRINNRRIKYTKINTQASSASSYKETRNRRRINADTKFRKQGKMKLNRLKTKMESWWIQLTWIHIGSWKGLFPCTWRGMDQKINV